ncbi:MAG: hypothetical protein WB783_05250 [Arenicellales bacterium]
MTVQTTAGRTTWAQTPERGNMFMMRVMTWLSLRLGRRAARSVLHLIAAYFVVFAPTSRRASSDYLRRALGRAPRWREIYRHFFTFAATIHDRIYLLNRRFDLFELEVHGETTLFEVIRKHNGVFLMGAHLGSFEIIHALGRENTDLHIARVMYEENARNINAMFAAINPAAVPDTIGLGHVDSMLRVQERLDEGGVVGVLADRAHGESTLYPVTILGADACLPSGPFRMAALLRRPVMFMTGLYLGGNSYAIHFDPIADFSEIGHDERNSAVETAMVRYAQVLDQYCRKAPYNWFNFFNFWQPATPSTAARSQ